MASFVNEVDLEVRLTKAKVDQLFDDDGDGVADQRPLQELISDANDTVESILFGKGFSREQLNELSRDGMVRRAATGIAAQIAGERRTEWLDPDTGKGQYDAMGVRGRENLKRLAAGELRSRLEASTAGANSTLKGQQSVGRPKFVFSRDPSSNDPVGPGGF